MSSDSSSFTSDDDSDRDPDKELAQSSYDKNRARFLSGGAKTAGGNPSLMGRADETPSTSKFMGVKWWTWKSFWFLVFLGVAAVAIVALVLASIAFDDDDVDGFVLDFKVLKREVVPSEHETSGDPLIEVQHAGSEKTTNALHQGVSLKRKGNKIVGTTTNIGLGLSQASDGTVFVVNSGVIDIILGGGLGAEKMPLPANVFSRAGPHYDEEGNEYDEIDYGVESDTERTIAPHPAGFAVKLTNMGVTSLKASTTLVPSAKRDIGERTVSYLSEGPGITVFGADNTTLEIINTGVINISNTDGSVTIGGNSSFPTISVTGFTPITTISVVVTHTQLAAGANVTLQGAVSATAQYVLISMSSRGGGSVNFSGGGGDRNLILGAGARTWYSISAANLAAAGSLTYIPANAAPGFVPDSTNAPNSATTAGTHFFLKYSGGTTDFSAGQIEMNLVLLQVTQ